MFLFELIFVFLKIITRVAVGVIIIIILRDFTANGFLYIDGEFLIIHERAGVCFNIILLTIILTVL